jgi:hypothetical protein
MGQSIEHYTRLAGWNVHTARSKDIVRVAELGGGNVDDRLGGAWLYFRALWDVEGTTKKIEDCKSSICSVVLAGAADRSETLRSLRAECLPRAKGRRRPRTSSGLTQQPNRFRRCKSTFRMKGANVRRYRGQRSCDGMFVGFESASSSVIEILSQH